MENNPNWFFVIVGMLLAKSKLDENRRSNKQLEIGNRRALPWFQNSKSEKFFMTGQNTPVARPKVHQSSDGPIALSSASANLLLLVILALGVAFRFAALGQIARGYDDSYPAYDALRMLDGREWVQIGQSSSVFLDNPALMTYIQAIPLLIWRSPWSVHIFITALNTLAIWLVYKTVQPLLGRGAGLMAALLIAVNPWIVHFSRTTWVQSLMPLFMPFVAWGFWPAMVTDRRWSRRVLLGGVALVAMLQTYIQAWLVLPQLGILITVFYRRLPKRPLLIVLLLFVASLVVYGVGLAGVWESNQSKLVGFVASSETELHFTREGLDHALRFVTGRNFDYEYGREETAVYQIRRAISLLVSNGLGLAVWAGIVRALIGLWRGGQERRLGLILLVWFWTPVLLMSFSAFSIHIHYLLLTCPAGHVLAAWGIVAAGQTGWRWWGKRPFPISPVYLFVPVIVLLTLVFGLNLYYANQEAARHPVQSRFDGWTLEASASVGDTIRELVGRSEGVFPRRIFAEGHAALLSGLSGLYVRTGLELDFPAYVVLPGEEPLLYVLLNETIMPGALGPKQQSLPERDLIFADGTRASFVMVAPYSREDALALPEVVVDWRSESGLTLLGYTLAGNGAAKAGQSTELTTYWRVDERPSGSAEWYVGAFYHVLNDARQIVVNSGDHRQWGHQWQVGDVYVERASILLPDDLPPGDYQLEWGLFDNIHMRNFALQSPNGPVEAYALPIRVE